VYFTLQNGGRRAVTFTPAHRDQLTALASGALKETAAVRIHAFSWTTSEIRMALEGPEPARLRFTRALGARHRQVIHAQLCGQDCLFERAYRASALATEQELLDVAAHIHAAPVRAGLASREADYPWSSAGAYQGTAWFHWLTTELIVGLNTRRGAGLPARRASFSEPA